MENDLPLEHYNNIWKILFFALWDSDKQKVQNDLSERISDMMTDFSQGKLIYIESFMKWVNAAFYVLSKEWNRIDYLRINKFLYLVRYLYLIIDNLLVK